MPLTLYAGAFLNGNTENESWSTEFRFRPRLLLWTNPPRKGTNPYFPLQSVPLPDIFRKFLPLICNYHNDNGNIFRFLIKEHLAIIARSAILWNLHNLPLKTFFQENRFLKSSNLSFQYSMQCVSATERTSSD